MYDEILNALCQSIRTELPLGRPEFEAEFQLKMAQAMNGIALNDYVEDCIFHIEQALELLLREPEMSRAAREKLVGAIEALRDELHLCQNRPETDSDIDQVLA